MKAVRVHQFGGLETMQLEEIARPSPATGQVLVRVKAAGVGPWDAWVRGGQSALPQPLPLTLGSDIAGVVEAIGEGVTSFKIGDEVFGVTNAQFTGAYAEYAVAEAAMIARKPAQLSFVDATSLPVVATTAWQMVFDYGHVASTHRVLVHGAAGNVGAYAVQFARQTGAEVIATTFPRDIDYVRSLGANQIIDAKTTRFDEIVNDVDVVIDTVGGETQDRSFAVLKRGGVLVSSAAQPDAEKAAQYGVRGVFFLVEVSTHCLNKIAALFNDGQITTDVGEVLPLDQARLEHEMLAGKPHRRGKIVLQIA